MVLSKPQTSIGKTSRMTLIVPRAKEVAKQGRQDPPGVLQESSATRQEEGLRSKDQDVAARDGPAVGIYESMRGDILGSISISIGQEASGRHDDDGSEVSCEATQTDDRSLTPHPSFDGSISNAMSATDFHYIYNAFMYSDEQDWPSDEELEPGVGHRSDMSQ
eukprot:Nitzschia sp. Nitz4//scaffold92_size79448//62974//63462//NITZ4_005399-RA/size79448-processed-gene-0.75-mRNA-1//-1//CDS//3329560210//6469//frame0